MTSTDPSAEDGPVESYRFTRAARLLDGRAYDRVFGDNRRLADRLWTVLVHEVFDGVSDGRDDQPDAAAGRAAGPTAPAVQDAPGSSPARLGLAIAKKRAKRAVDRNRIKRVARESFRHASARLAGHHVVVMNRDAATSASAGELRTALDDLWSRLLRQSAAAEHGRPQRHARRDGGPAPRTSGNARTNDRRKAGASTGGRPR